MKEIHTEIAIIGAGPAGALTAIHLARQGFSTTIIERHPMPRFHIGESLTGKACNLLRNQYGLGALLSESGFPVKHGTTVYGESAQSVFHVAIPKTSDNPEGKAWQVRRDVFDAALLDEAIASGATLLPGSARSLIQDGENVTGLRTVQADGTEILVHSSWLIDASGTNRFLGQAGLLGPRIPGNYDHQISVFSRIENAVHPPEEHGGDTRLFYKGTNHWAWLIPLSETTSSIGVTAPISYMKSTGKRPEAYLEHEIRHLSPELNRRVPDRRFAEPVRALSNYSYRYEKMVGDGFLAIGDARQFIDPIFSYGVHIALFEASMAARVISEAIRSPQKDLGSSWRELHLTCTRGAETVQTIIDAFWGNPIGFAYAVHHKYPEEASLLFAGNLYEKNRGPCYQALEKIAAASTSRIKQGT